MSLEKIKIMQITSSHGLDGWVKIQCFAENPHILKEYNPYTPSLKTPSPFTSFTLEKMRDVGGKLCAKFSECNDRTTADSLRGIELFVDRSKLPQPEKGEFYFVDLAGFDVTDPQGNIYGVVTSVEDFGASPVLMIQMNESKKNATAPWIPEAVLDIDEENKKIILNNNFLLI
jgi:16S rRNA processing protein RimM